MTPAYTQTTQTALKEPLLGDLILLIKKSFPRGEFHPEDFWIDWLRKQGCSQGTAEDYVEELKGTVLFYDDKGWAIG